MRLQPESFLQAGGRPEHADGIGLGEAASFHSQIVRPLTVFVNPLTVSPNNVRVMKLKTLADRAKFARERAGYDTEAKAAKAIGCSRPLIYSWEGRSSPPAETIGGTYLLAAARAYKVRPEWLALESDDDGYPWRPAIDTALPDDHEPVRAYSQQVGLSEGEEAQEYAETHRLKFRADSLARKRLKAENLAVFYGKGDSMEPRVHTGDAVLFDLSDTRPRDGQLFVITVPGAGADSYSIKRCEMLDDLVLFKADNPAGDHNWKKPRRMDDPKKPIKIIGRVRWIGSWEG